MEIDPLTPLNHATAGFNHVLAGHPEAAVPFYRRFYEMDPENPFGLFTNAWVLLFARRFAEAEPFVERLEAGFPTNPYLSIARAQLWGAQGQRDRALAAITPDVLGLAAHNEMWSRELTHCYALAGRVDEAIHWFENTVRIGTINYPFWSRHDWMLDNLRGDERFQQILEQVRAEWAEGVSPEEAGRYPAPQVLDRSASSTGPAQRSADTTSPVASDTSVVVLPFANLSPDPDNEYFGDGLTAELIADLSKIGPLRVISHSSAMRLKGTDKALTTIGHELNVRYVLEGTVRKAGNSVRITSQLIDATDDTHLWAEKYSGTLEDVFDIQERVSREIAKALQIELTSGDDRRVATRPIEDVSAYECYLRAKHEIFRFTQEGLDRALELLRQGLEIAGDNALLYVTLGTAYWQHVNTGLDPDERYLQQAEECARKAFELEPEFAPAHCLRGLVWWHRGNAQEAAREFKHALTLDPDNPQALLFRAAVLAAAGKEWTAEANRLLEIDPLTPINQVVPAWGHLLQGRFSLAAAECRRWLEREPGSPLASLLLGDILARDGHPHEAESVLEQLAAREPETVFGQVALFLSHGLGGRATEALQAVTPSLTASVGRDLQYSWEMATGYALIKETDEALEWLENATRHGFINYPFLSQYDPLLEHLRQEQRFKALMEEVRSQWERFEV